MRIPLYCFTMALAISGAATAEENWNQFRGPTGRGHSDAKDVPVSWDESNIAWKVELKGEGQSSPVNWGDRMFLTSASEDGTERFVLCLSVADGKTIWEKSVKCDNPEDFHAMNGRATPTCATDGKTVVAFFGPGGLHAYDMEGKPKWSLDLGDFPGSWGIAASPILVDNMVIQNCDCEGDSRLLAVDIETGKTIWETKRETKPKGGWSTPTLIDYEGKRELVLNGEFGVRGYDPANGKELWFCKGFNGRGAPVPDYADGKLFVVNGKPGDTYCVKPGGSGDVTDSRMVWHAPRKGGRDLPSPAVVDGYLFVASMSGIATCYDAETGKPYYSERLGEIVDLAAAPLVANGLVYMQTVTGGDVIVIRPGKELDIVAVNSLGEGAKNQIFRATLAPIGDKLFIRSRDTLYCIQK